MNTHSAVSHFDYTDWKDLSDKIDILFFIENLRAVRLHVYDNIRYSPKAQRMHDEQQAEFISHNNRDDHYDFNENEYIPGYKANIGVYNGGKPCYMMSPLMIIFDLIALGWI